MQISKRKGTCVLCNQVFDQQVIENHFNDCIIEKNLSSKKKRKPIIDIFRIKMFAGGMKYWFYVEVLANATLRDLDQLLEAILLKDDSDNEGYFGVDDKYVGKNDKIINTTFKKSTQFSYKYRPAAFNLHGEIIDCYKGYLNEKTRLLGLNISPFLECNDCVHKPKFQCISCCDYFCTKCLKKHPCGENDAYLIDD